jgi:hypothetical protein
MNHVSKNRQHDRDKGPQTDLLQSDEADTTNTLPQTVFRPYGIFPEHSSR